MSDFSVATQEARHLVPIGNELQPTVLHAAQSSVSVEGRKLRTEMRGFGQDRRVEAVVGGGRLPFLFQAPRCWSLHQCDDDPHLAGKWVSHNNVVSLMPLQDTL